jgi:hypothetical protein
MVFFWIVLMQEEREKPFVTCSSHSRIPSKPSKASKHQLLTVQTEDVRVGFGVRYNIINNNSLKTFVRASIIRSW